MAEFPKLVPAFSIRLQTSPRLIMGKTFSNSGMAVGPIEHGTVKSIPGYGAEPFDGEVVNEADVFYVDAGFRGVKLDFRSVIRTGDVEAVYFSFLGFIEGNEDTALVLRGHPDAKSTQFGSSRKLHVTP